MVNRIGEPEQERLGLYSEEMGEAQQVVGKILRHGIDSYHPDRPGVSNAQLLELEAGHVLAAIDLLVACGTLDREALEKSRRSKLEKLRRWLHCGTNLDAVEELLGADNDGYYEFADRMAAARREAAEAHMCDGKNIAYDTTGRPYCAHCGWNDPAKERKAKAEEARRTMGLPELKPLADGKHRVGGPSGHIYDEHGTSDCANGCGCWAGPARSGGPDGIDPLGACPKAATGGGA